MAIKTKELKNDALVNIQVNKNFYMMAKAASFTILQSMHISEKGDAYLRDTMIKKYEELDDTQKSFYTIILLLAEIEKQATENNMFDEKEILEPGDKNYVEPISD